MHLLRYDATRLPLWILDAIQYSILKYFRHTLTRKAFDVLTNSRSFTMSSKLLPSLLRCNQAILQQKIDLLSVIESKFGSQELSQLFQRKCNIVQASIGQHYRHSLDHSELAILVASTHLGYSGNFENTDVVALRYDQRVRGGMLEKDVMEARKRIVSMVDVLDEIKSNHEANPNLGNITKQSVNAAFMLSGDCEDGEMELQSTIGRELGFVAHHAIHHNAMVRVIAVNSIGLEEHELPEDFGKAPSTIRFESNN